MVKQHLIDLFRLDYFFGFNVLKFPTLVAYQKGLDKQYRPRSDCFFKSDQGFPCLLFLFRERSGSVVECLILDRKAAGSSFSGVTALCPLARHINPSLVLVQPKKTCPDVNERLLTGT